MKTLQNNFTTPEQSKRLLELGVHIKSADCYYCIINATIQQGIEVICDSNIFFDINTYLKDFFPCWSVGRLIEIADICYTSLVKKEYYIKQKDCNTDYLLKIFELAGNSMDFSKLEE